MPRPTKCRRVNFFPPVKYFKPIGVPMRNIKEVCLSVEEVEAIRLKDLEGLEQEQGAERMNVSRPTFHRILTAARYKIAEALFNGKAIRIEGGNFEIPPCHFKCNRGHEWDVPFDLALAELPRVCPICQMPEIECCHPFEKECVKPGHLRCCQLNLGEQSTAALNITNASKQ
jgi:predicted DNA-binding protein (UPF0251 family)